MVLNPFYSPQYVRFEQLAPAYDSTATYSVGDYVTYEYNLYQCTTAVTTAGAFDPSKWNMVDVTDQLTDDLTIASSTTGVNPSITDSADGLVQDVKVYGRSDVSKNLFNQDAEHTAGVTLSVANGETVSNVYFTAYTDYIPCTGNTTYVMSAGSNNNTICAYRQDKTYISGTSNYNEGTTTPLVFTTPAEAAYLRVSLLTDHVNSAQLELGSTATPYEPYGIISIGDSGSLDVQTCGKNLFDKNATDTNKGYLSGYYLNEYGNAVNEPNLDISEYIEILPSTKYTISGLIGNAPAFCLYDQNKNYVYGEKYISRAVITITTTSNAKYIRLSIHSGAKNSCQLELGTTATSYEPYISTTASLTTGLPLCGIPVNSGETYTDEQGQKWLADTAGVEGVVKRCGVIDLGDLEWSYGGWQFVSEVIPDLYVKGLRLTPMICADYQVIDDGRSAADTPDKSIYTVFIDNDVNKPALICIDNSYSTAADFIQAVTGIKLVYILNPTVEIPLTTAEKSALLNLKTFDSTTNVTITDDPYIDFSYLKNTQNGKAIAQLSENLMSMLSGGTPTFSFARAVYDAGDTVTATDGTTTLTSDTSGDYVFAIPNSGTWTFSDGTTTITKSLTTYGEIVKCNLISLLPASVEKNILAEIRAGHFNLGEDVGEGFKATNSNTFSLAEDGSLVTSATGHVYYDLVSANQPATIYFVGKCPDNTTGTRIVIRLNANSAGEAPGFYTETNKILNATYYGSNTPTDISKTSLFVCAMSLAVTGNYKWAYYYANDTFTTNKNVTNAGRYCYFSGTPTTPNTPTGTTEGGDAVTISYIGIVNGAEDATTIATNIAAIMTAFGIS